MDDHGCHGYAIREACSDFISPHRYPSTAPHCNTACDSVGCGDREHCRCFFGDVRYAGLYEDTAEIATWVTPHSRESLHGHRRASTYIFWSLVLIARDIPNIKQQREGNPRPRLRHFMQYDPFTTESMATTTSAKSPDMATVPPAVDSGKAGEDPSPINASLPTNTKAVAENPLAAAPLQTPAQPSQEPQRQPSATEVINAVLAQDEAKTRPHGALAEAMASKSRTSSRSRSRSRPTSAAGSRRGSTSVWDNDPEKKQRKLMEKILGHHWTPDFLK